MYHIWTLLVKGILIKKNRDIFTYFRLDFSDACNERVSLFIVNKIQTRVTKNKKHRKPIVVFAGADGFRTLFSVEVRVFRRLRASRQEFPNAGRVGRGVSMAGGVATVRRPVRAQTVELVPETKRVRKGETAPR